MVSTPLSHTQPATMGAIMKKLAILISTVLCTSCSAQPNINTNPAQLSKSTISKRNARPTHFLTRYDCSVGRIEKKAEEGDANAAYALGYIYYYGIGLKTDQQSAKLWIERAANLKQPLAAQALQMLSLNKKGILSAQPMVATQNRAQEAIRTAPTALARVHIHHPDTPISALSKVIRHPKALKNASKVPPLHHTAGSQSP